MNLEKLKVQELSFNEQKTVQGGWYYPAARWLVQLVASGVAWEVISESYNNGTKAFSDGWNAYR